MVKPYVWGVIFDSQTFICKVRSQCDWKSYYRHYRPHDLRRTHNKVVALVGVMLGVDFGQNHIELKAGRVSIDVVIACVREEDSSAQSEHTKPFIKDTHSQR